jgi:simple sugar transport system ATP-binding protein
MPLWENLMLAGALRARFTGRRRWLRCRRAASWCGEVMDQFAIRAESPRATAGALSGGNRQRLAVARALAAAPDVLVAHDICRGLDLRATAELHRRLRDFAAAGGAVLLISSDLDELFELCTRLFVISGGRLTETPANERDPSRIGLLMAGGPR